MKASLTIGGNISLLVALAAAVSMVLVACAEEPAAGGNSEGSELLSDQVTALDIGGDHGYFDDLGVLRRPDQGVVGNTGADALAESPLIYCEESAECEFESYCLGGICLPAVYGCEDDSDCHEGAFCGNRTGRCITVCNEDGSCIDDWLCDDNDHCQLPCGEDDYCPWGSACVDRPFAEFLFCGFNSDTGMPCNPYGVCPDNLSCDELTGFCGDVIFR
jgi:hypothetical protein